MASERKGFTVKWRIENISREVFFLRDPLESPGFLVNKVADTRWKLNFRFLMGYKNPRVALSLVRETLDDGPSDVLLDVELSALASDESPLKLQEFKNISFSNQTASPLLMLREDIFSIDYDSPHQHLTFRCRMWPSQGLIFEDTECIILTRMREELKCFDVLLERFSALQPGQQTPAFIRSLSEETPHVSMYVCLNMQDEIEIVGMGTHDWRQYAYNCKFYLLDAARVREECMKGVVWVWCFSNRTFHLNLTKKRLMDNKERYLPNDILSLYLEMKSCTGIDLNEIDNPEYKCETPGSAPRRSSKQKKRKMSSTPLEPEELVTTLKNDLMSMHQDRIFCDTKLRSGAETFPAHRIVLSARSPVFKAMFTHDMKERNNDCVDIPDLSPDTIRRMLLFLYTDTTEDLDWDNAKDLYTAADKYEILSLKRMCSSFLKDNVRASNVCEILALSDMHQDSDLKSATQKFILRNDKEVFRSKEWKMFIKSNAELAADTMCLKYA